MLPDADNFFGCLASRNDPEDRVQILTGEMLISSHKTLRQVNCRLVARWESTPAGQRVHSSPMIRLRGIRQWQ